MKRFLIIFITATFIILIAAGIYGYRILTHSLPQTDGTVVLEGIRSEIEITFDAMGIPQIWADSERDGYFAMGYVHAADRLFQMDLTRRIARGTLSELLGKSVLDFDRLQRKFGHHRLAESQIDHLTDENRRRLQAYADGVNANVAGLRTLPFEYHLLRKPFEPFTVFDLLCMVSFQTWFSDFLLNPDQAYIRMAEEVGEERALELIKGYPAWAPKTVPQEQASRSPKAAFQSHVAHYLLGSGHLPYLLTTASNSWVISPRLSESGAAMLASDPHLEITRLPQFWYYLGLHIRESNTNVLGISTPGLPFVVMGHNSHAAWAFTVGGIDITDYYIEKINEQDSTLYLTPSGWKRFVMLDEVITVDGEPQDSLVVRLTGHGPVIVENDSLGTCYSVHWAGFDMDLNTTVEAGFQLARTGTFKDFRKTVTRFGALDANWTFADRDGNIGYQLGTPIPIRPERIGLLPVPGWEDGYDWLGYQPLEKTPHSYNPAKGWLATCNNEQDEANLDYRLQGYFAADRITRISNLLAARNMFSVEDMQSYQMDLVDAYLLRWKDKLVPLLRNAGFNEEANRLSGWDGQTGSDSWSTAFVVLYIYYFKHVTLDDKLSDTRMYFDDIWVEALFDSGAAHWFDNPDTEDRTETREDVYQVVLEKTLRRTGNKTWGDINSLTMEHPLAVVPVLREILGLRHGPWPWQGTKGSLNAAFLMEQEDGSFKTIVGPSWRFVIDFADIDGVTMVLPAGNSGHPLSPHSMDFLSLWKKGERWNVPFHYEKVLEKAAGVLHLLPVHTEE